MNEDLAKRISHLFDGIGNNLQNTDPEWVDIIANFSQKETVSVSRLTQKEQMLCILSFGGISTAGWQTIVLGIIIPGTV